MIKRIVILVFLVGVIGAIAYAKATSTRTARVALAEEGRIRTYIDERARTTLPHTHRVTMPLDGRIMPIQVKAGDPVRRGDRVAEMDVADLDTAVAEAQARMEAIEARIRKQEQDALESLTLREYEKAMESMDALVEASGEKVKASQARLEYADWWLKAQEEIYEEKVSPMKTLKEARVEQAEAKMLHTTDRLTFRAISAVQAAMEIYPTYLSEYLALKDLGRAVMDKQREEARVALERAERDRGRALITSPVDGVVLQRHVSNERVLPAGSPLLDIGDLKELEVTVEVLSQEVVAVQPGDEVEIFGPSIGEQPIHGTVKRIKPEAFTKVSSLGVEQQRVEVIISMDPEDLASLRERESPLGVGYRVRCRIYTAQKDGVVKIPRTALFRGGGSTWQVFVVREGKAEKTRVQVGLANDQEVEVVEGLSARDPVIVAPEPSLTSGTRVSWD